MINDVGSRRDLLDMDGRPLDDIILFNTAHGSLRHYDIVLRSVADMIFGICQYNISRITMDNDIKSNRWRTDTWHVSKYHAKCIVQDWLAQPPCTARTLLDIILCYINEIKSDAFDRPVYSFADSDFVIYNGRNVPKILDKSNLTMLPVN